MKKNIILLFVILSCIGLSGCHMGLDELPAFEDAKLLNFWFEHREVVEKTNPDGSKYEQVVFTDLKGICTFNQIAETDGVIQCEVVVKKASSSKTIDLANITGKATISTASIIEPINGSPQLGKPGNYSSPTTYMVTSADKKISIKYVINVHLE